MAWVDLTEERRAEQIRWVQQQKRDEAREKEAVAPPKQTKSKKPEAAMSPEEKAHQEAYKEYKKRQRIAGEEAKIRGEEHATTYQQFKRKQRIKKEKTKIRKSRLHLEMGKRPKIPLLETGLPKKKRQGRKLTRNRPIGL